MTDKRADNVKGALTTTLTMLVYVVNDTLMKTILATMSLYQAMFVRGLMVLAVVFGLAFYLNQIKLNLSMANKKLLFYRSALEIVLSFFVLSALATLPLASFEVIMQAVPLCLTVGAAMFFAERVGWRRWTATIVGFIGVLIIVRPGTQEFDANTFYALASVICLVARDLLTRKLPKTLSALHTVLWTSVATCLFGGLGVPFVEWTPLFALDYIYLACASIAIVAAYWMSVEMMRTGDIGFISQFRYTGVLWAIIAGMAFFNETPDAATLIGAAVIVAAGLYSISRERYYARLS